MKKTKQLIIFILLLSTECFTQTYDCQNVNPPPETPQYDSLWRAQIQPSSCGDLSYYIDTSSTLIYRINFHFFRPSTGSPNYNGPTDYYKNVTAADCDTLVKFINYRMSHLHAPDIAATPPVTNNYVNSHIQYQNMGVYFHTNDSAWTSWGFSSYVHNSYAINSNSEINIYFTADPAKQTAGWGPHGFTIMSSHPWTPTLWCNGCFNQVFVGTMIHELGHTAGVLGHTDVAASWGGAQFQPSNCYFPASFGGITDYFDETVGPCWGNVNSVSQGGCASNNIMGYNNDRTYLSPNQIGAFYYSVYAGVNTKFTNSPLPSDRCTYDSTKSINITSNTIWNHVVVTNGDVVVQPGKTLTIQCATVFSPGSRLIIEPTARVILDGGTLFTKCGVWQGVQVRGDKNNNQGISKTTGLPFYQGLLQIQNGGSIQSAQVGVTTIAKFNNGNQDWNKTGGIIKSTLGNFLGNIKDIEFLYYQNVPSGSQLSNTSFNANNQPNGGSGGWPDDRVSLYGINGVKFYGCSFKASGTNKGNGIGSLDASFFIEDLNTSTHCRFEKFHYGIYAQNVSIINASSVNGAEFYLNDTGGIYMSKGDYSTITNNIFKVYVATGGGSSSIKYGVYMNQSDGYSIRGNQFLGSTITWNTNVFAGVYINNGGTGNNSVYNNYFANLNYGLTPQETNQGIPGNSGSSGLIMNCNDFVNCKNNIRVVGSPLNFQTGILKVQGSFTNQNLYVRNTYGAPSCGSQDLYFVSVLQGYQLWHPSFTGTPYQPIPQNTCSDSAKVRAYQLTGTYNKSTQCPANCTGCRTMQEIEESITKNTLVLEGLRGVEDAEQRKNLQHEIDFEKNQLGLLSNERVRNFLTDTTLNNPMDSVIAELKLRRNPNYKKQLVRTYLQKGDLNKAGDFRDSVMASEPNNTSYNAIVTELISHRSNPQGYIANLKNDFGLKSALLSIANNPLAEGNAEAQGLLNLAYGMKFKEHFVSPEQMQEYRQNNSQEDQDFEVFPNPATNSVTVKCELNKEETATIEIVDLSGRIVKAIFLREGSNHIIDVSNLNNGVYFVSLHKQNGSITNKRVVIMQ